MLIVCVGGGSATITPDFGLISLKLTELQLLFCLLRLIMVAVGNFSDSPNCHCLLPTADKMVHTYEGKKKKAQLLYLLFKKKRKT